LESASIATKVQTSPTAPRAAFSGVTFLGLRADERPDFIDLDAASRHFADRGVLIAGAGRADIGQQPKDGALRTPVRRDVDRTEQPSTSAEMTATRLAVLNLFMHPSYYTALALQAESDGSAKKILTRRGLL
jgi:hypothetical protein